MLLCISLCSAWAKAPVPYLPAPEKTQSLKTIRLNEAVLLALRQNPELLKASLNRILAKYRWSLARRPFHPRLSLQAGIDWAKNVSEQSRVGGELSTDTPLGGNAGMVWSRQRDQHMQTLSIQLKQPILQAVMMDFQHWEGKDQNTVSQLEFKEQILSVIQQVIMAYREVISSKTQADIQLIAVDTAEQTLAELQLQHQLGRVAGADLLEQQLQLSRSELALSQARLALKKTKQNLLILMGLMPGTHFDVIDEPVSVDQKDNALQAVNFALANDLSYQLSVVAFKQAERGVLQSRVTHGPKIFANASFSWERDDRKHHVGHDHQIGLEAKLPLWDSAESANQLSSHVSLQQAKITETEERSRVLLRTLGHKQAVLDAVQQLKLSEQTLTLSEKRLENAKLKLSFGRIPVVEFVREQEALTKQKLNLVNTRIAYLNAVTQYRRDLGLLLSDFEVYLNEV